VKALLHKQLYECVLDRDEAKAVEIRGLGTGHWDLGMGTRDYGLRLGNETGDEGLGTWVWGLGTGYGGRGTMD